MMMMMIMLMKPVVLGAGVAKGQGPPPPLSSPLLALMINVTFARECTIVFELIGLLLSSRRGVFFHSETNSVFFTVVLPIINALYILLSSVPGQNEKRQVFSTLQILNKTI